MVKMKTSWAILCTSSMLLLGGCFPTYDYNSANNYGSKRDEPKQDTSRAYQTQQQYAIVSHNHSTLDMNQFLSDQVAAMDGVNSAIVMMADNTAYVAITIDKTATGTKSGAARNETNNQGTVRGLYSPHTPFTDYRDPKQLATGSNSYDTVMKHEHISHLFKQKIAEKIRSLQPTVVDVYISANRVYINEMNRFAQEAWKGQDLKQYLPQFDALSEQVFGTQPTHPTSTE